jgi:predicted DCC family thiol-disulfide oxidoreductase YuxK
MTAASSPEHVGANVIVVDGTCIFCNRLVDLILRRDRERHFRFAHVQSDFARAALARHGMTPDIDAIYLVCAAETEAEQVLMDGAVGRQVWPRIFPAVGLLMRMTPLPILNLFYRGFARIRYRLFGQYPACRIPTPDERARFVER